MSETAGTEEISEEDPRDERQDPSIAGSPEVVASPEDAEVDGGESSAATGDQSGRLEEREQRQHATQQHGDTFAVDIDEPTDTSGVEQGSAPNGVTALPGNERTDEGASGANETRQ